MIARSAPSRSSPAPSARRYAALGLGRSARPSKRGNHAANAYLTMLARTEDKRSSDSVRQVEYWFPHLSVAPQPESAVVVTADDFRTTLINEFGIPSRKIYIQSMGSAQRNHCSIAPE